MFTKRIKQDASNRLLNNTPNKYLAGIVLFLIPLLLQSLIVWGIINSKNLSLMIVLFIINIIAMYLLLYLQSFLVRTIRGRSSLKESFPDIKLTIKYMLPMIIEKIIVIFLVFEVINGTTFLISFIIIISLLFTLYMNLYVAGYLLSDGKVKVRVILSAIPELLWKSIVLLISFIPLIIAIVVTGGLVAFWKVTYIFMAYEELVVLVYDKYGKNSEISMIKHLVISGLALFILVGVGNLNATINNSRTHNKNQFEGLRLIAYNCTAYNGQEITIFIKDGQITQVLYNLRANLEKHIDGTARPLMSGNEKMDICLVFDTKGKIIGFEKVKDTSGLEGISDIEEIKKASKSVMPEYGVTFEVADGKIVGF